MTVEDVETRPFDRDCLVIEIDETTCFIFDGQQSTPYIISAKNYDKFNQIIQTHSQGRPIVQIRGDEIIAILNSPFQATEDI